MVHSLSIPLFSPLFLPHLGSSLSPHKTVHSLRLLTRFHPFLSHPVCPKALSKLRLHDHIFSSLRLHQPLLFRSFHPGLDLFTLSSALESFVVSPPISTVIPWILDAMWMTTSFGHKKSPSAQGRQAKNGYKNTLPAFTSRVD